MPEMQKDEKFLRDTLVAIVEFPEEIKVERTVDEMGVLLSLSVAKEDMGRVIGRAGNTAASIRTLLRVVGMTNQARVNLKINEPAI